MTNHPHGGSEQYPMGRNPGGQKPKADTAQRPNIFSSSTHLPEPVRQVQLAAVVSAVGAVVMQIVAAITTNVVMSSQYQGMGMDAGLLVGGSVIASIFGLVITAGLYALVLIPLLGGKNWGRILGIIFAILGGLSGLFGLFGAITWFSLSAGLGIVLLIQNLVSAGTAIWFLIFVFRAEVSAWYAPNPYAGYQQSWGPYDAPGSYGYGGQTPPPGYRPGAGGYGQNPPQQNNPYGGPAGPGGGGPQQGPPQ